MATRKPEAPATRQRNALAPGIIAALAVMGGVLWFASGPTALWTEIGGLERAGRLALVVGAGALAYFATLFALGFRLRDFRRRGTA